MKNKLEKTLTFISNFRRILLIKRYKKRGIILDLGCGEGSFAKQVYSKNWQVFAVDPNLKRKNLKEGIVWYKKSLSECNFAGDFFDLITMWHVLEHLPKPEKELKEISRILKKDGLLILSTPNLGGLGFKIASEKWFHFNKPIHKNLFNLQSLKKLLKKTGFAIVKTNYPLWEYPLDLYHSFVEMGLKNVPLTFLFIPLFVLLRSSLALLGKGETIEVICRKNE